VGAIAIWLRSSRWTVDSITNRYNAVLCDDAILGFDQNDLLNNQSVQNIEQWLEDANNNGGNELFGSNTLLCGMKSNGSSLSMKGVSEKVKTQPHLDVNM
jgi:hypothetical protein